MANVTVVPSTFNLVNYDSGEIRSILEELADKIGLPADAQVQLVVNEATPLGRIKLVSSHPLVMEVEGGALEDSHNLRHLSKRSTVDACGRLMLRAFDRSQPGFADAPDEEGVTLQQLTAWDAYCMGRLERAGYDARKPRRQYHFRNRHGFTDVADAVFERLWSADSLTWADIEAACAETAAVKPAKAS
jgi:hypothetical protein